PLPPGYAWAWTTQGWTPISYTGPTWTPLAASTAPGSPPASSPPAAPLDPLIQAEHAHRRARAQVRESVARYGSPPQDAPDRARWLLALAARDKAVCSAMFAALQAYRATEAARGTSRTMESSMSSTSTMTSATISTSTEPSKATTSSTSTAATTTSS